jgi:predicted transcriptional regulator
MKRHKATATREGRYWVIDVPGVGVTQGRSVSEAKEMTRDLIAVMTDAQIEDVQVDIDFQVGDVTPGEVRGARQAVAAAAQAQERAAQMSRQMVARLRDAGVSGRDAAGILGISPQRVSQLVAKTSSVASRTTRSAKVRKKA